MFGMFGFGSQGLDSDCPLQNRAQFIAVVGFGEVGKGSLGQRADRAVGACVGG